MLATCLAGALTQSQARTLAQLALIQAQVLRTGQRVLRRAVYEGLVACHVTSLLQFHLALGVVATFSRLSSAYATWG